MRVPSADDVARAIVAACKETGEDPIECATGTLGLRARHYAMHALAHFFTPTPGIPAERALIGRLCGVRWGGATVAYNYYSTSLNQVFKPFVSEWMPEHNAAHWAKWFNDEAFDRVKAAIKAGLWEPLSRVRFVRGTRQKIGVITGFDGPLTMRRTAVPAERCLDVTAEFMGDPRPGQSALDRRALPAPAPTPEPDEDEE